ncbi:conserved Plasmodium protein, unknown function [Plasmodium malariae]|uniref:Uncharacterized protein n=1 Tax=Plasmodium malariae TaxID=5858 RepID=A0A1C3L0Q4_PLAMA|nr:conserved Plasmodium protein, unknown function [Plasmodium malariae]
MCFNCIVRKIYSTVLIFFLCTTFFESACYCYTIGGRTYRLTPIKINTRQKDVINFIKNDSCGVIKSKSIKKKKKGNDFSVNSINIPNSSEFHIPQEYLDYNIPEEPIYPYISVPDNLYTKQKNESERKENDKGKLVQWNGQNDQMGNMPFDECKKKSNNEIVKIYGELPEPTLEDYIEDTEYEKYIHPCLIKKIEKGSEYYIHHSMMKHIDEHDELATVDCFDVNDLEHDLTEYDSAFSGIGPWPSINELRMNENNYEFDKTDLEIEYNITYNKTGYREFKQNELKKRMKENEKSTSNDKNKGEQKRTEVNINIYSDIGREKINNDKLSELASPHNEDEVLPGNSEYTSNSITNVTVSDVRKLYYKKVIKSIREAKEEIIKWDERKKCSRCRWNLTKEELNLLPEQVRKLYFYKHKQYEEEKRDMIRKMSEVSVSQDTLRNVDQVPYGVRTAGCNSGRDPVADGIAMNNEALTMNLESKRTNEDDAFQNNFQNFRLLEDNVLYTKPKSPIDNILYEWDDSLQCTWRKRAEEVIRDVIMYDYPYKELRRPSNLDLYDVTWYAGKVEVFVTIEEGKNYNISLFDLKQLVKKIAERLKELEIDEEIVILPFFELIVSSLPSKNILVCRKDWNRNIGKDVVVFFKDNIFEPLEGILLGSPSVFHVIINVNDEKIENVMAHLIDKIVLKNTNDELRGHIVLKAGIGQERGSSEDKGGALSATEGSLVNGEEEEEEEGKQGDETKKKQREKENYMHRNVKKDITKMRDQRSERSTKFAKQDYDEDDDEDKIRGIQFDDLKKLKDINKSYKEKNIDIIKNINKIDDENNSSMINSPFDEDEEEEDEYEEDEEYDNEIESDNGEYDDYMPDE